MYISIMDGISDATQRLSRRPQVNISTITLCKANPSAADQSSRLVSGPSLLLYMPVLTLANLRVFHATIWKLPRFVKAEAAAHTWCQRSRFQDI